MLEKTNSKIFTFLLVLSALAVAAAAAIFSVTGLSMLYSGEMLYVAIAMGALEFSKIITASYLYRYWKETSFGLKAYLMIALLVLMVITSGGIYGYLTHSYQGATIGLDKINSQTQVLEQRKENLIAERERLINDIMILRQERQSTVENRNNEIAANNMAIDSNSVKYRAWRNSQVHKRYNIELTNIDNSVAKYTINLDSANVRLSRMNDKISDKKLEMIDTGADVGPLVYMARIFNTSMDNVMKWFTMVIVFVFDPLAIALIIALNVVLMRGRKKVKYKIGVDNAKPGDYSATYIPFDLKDVTLTPPTGSTEWWKNDPVMKPKLEDATRVLKEKKEFLQEIDDEIEEMEKKVEKKRPRFSQPNLKKEAPELIKPLADLVEDIKKTPTKKIVLEPVKEGKISREKIREAIKKVKEEKPVTKESKRITHVNEFFNKMRKEDGHPKEQKEYGYTRKRSPVTDDEIREYFEDAVRKVKKEGQGKITRTPFQSGGGVSISHIQDDPDIDYSIQE